MKTESVYDLEKLIATTNTVRIILTYKGFRLLLEIVVFPFL